MGSSSASAMRRQQRIAPWLLGLACSSVACGGRSVRSTTEEATGSGGSAGSAATGGAVGALDVGCPTEEPANAPLPSATCEVVPRDVDPEFTCAGDPCPITRALDLVCPSQSLDSFSIVATQAGAVVTTRDRYTLGAKLTTVEPNAATVADVANLEGSPVTYAFDDEHAWLFGTRTADTTSGQAQLGVLRGTETGWASSTIASSDSPRLTGAVVVDATTAYLTYLSAGLPSVPHLVKWDGACWTNEPVDWHSSTPEGRPTFADTSAVAVAGDRDEHPWVAGLVQERFVAGESVRSIYLRGPEQPAAQVAALPYEADAALDPPTLRLLSGGLDGTARSPVIAIGTAQGLFLVSAVDDSSTWSVLSVPEAARGEPEGTCPPVDEQYRPDPCADLTSCVEQLNDTSRDFGIARTQSGVTFVAWVAYSSDAAYSLEEHSVEGEMPVYWCLRDELSGTGVADLIVARVDGADLVASHFRFDTVGVLQGDQSVAMAASGDTLLIAAELDVNSAMTYLELDSRLLP